MTAPAPTDAGALREALATVLCDCLRYDRERGIIIGIADAVDEALAGPLASLLAARATTDADLAKAWGDANRVREVMLRFGLRAIRREAQVRSALAKARDEIAGLKAALKPFAEAAADLDDSTADGDHLWESPAAMNLTAGDLRAARSARDDGGSNV